MTTTAPAPTSAPTGGRQWPALLVFAAAVVVVAVVGGLAAGSSGETYDALDLPPYAPPSWLFGPVWTVLYVMIAVAGWLAWRRTGTDRATVVYGVQLVLNMAWTPLFFAAGWYTVALVEIVALLAAVLLTIAMFARRSRAAAWLLAPYAAWVAFATALNAGIVVLN
ncbi:tryptophan-rich sensory protein [Nocardioides marinquilinus]|uniref:Tryptophan-rich sensory protein n=1 Tax=Nocardioides marinquilinus TaxID=1210400 RepID=A0ABP9PP03_9ACTN